MNGMHISRLWIDDVEVDPETYFQELDDNDPDHIVCDCSPNIALCGTDVSHQEFAEDDEVPEFPCVVCVDMDEQPCSRCGCV